MHASMSSPWLYTMDQETLTGPSSLRTTETDNLQDPRQPKMMIQTLQSAKSVPRIQLILRQIHLIEVVRLQMFPSPILPSTTLPSPLLWLRRLPTSMSAPLRLSTPARSVPASLPRTIPTRDSNRETSERSMMKKMLKGSTSYPRALKRYSGPVKETETSRKHSHRLPKTPKTAPLRSEREIAQRRLLSPICSTRCLIYSMIRELTTTKVDILLSRRKTHRLLQPHVEESRAVKQPKRQLRSRLATGLQRQPEESPHPERHAARSPPGP